MGYKAGGSASLLPHCTDFLQAAPLLPRPWARPPRLPCPSFSAPPLPTWSLCACALPRDHRPPPIGASDLGSDVARQSPSQKDRSGLPARFPSRADICRLPCPVLFSCLVALTRAGLSGSPTCFQNVQQHLLRAGVSWMLVEGMSPPLRAGPPAVFLLGSRLSLCGVLPLVCRFELLKREAAL